MEPVFSFAAPEPTSVASPVILTTMAFPYSWENESEEKTKTNTGNKANAVTFCFLMIISF
jgi:hypothetical protein